MSQSRVMRGWGLLCLLLGPGPGGCKAGEAGPAQGGGEPPPPGADRDADAEVGADAGRVPDAAAAPDPDDDQDGLPESLEADLAAAYLPFLSVSPDDACPESAILFRLVPHPDDPSKVHIVYVVLYDDDCGTNGHPGDDEVFAVTIDPSVPPPAGILAMVAIAHQGTPCNAESRCQTCGPDGDTCSTTSYQDSDWPVVFVSSGKHGGYLKDGFGFGHCDGACFFADSCALAEAPARPPMLNAGEPEHPLTRDLTDSGLVTVDNGFEEPGLLHYDPWGTAEFGDAGVVSNDLVDSHFDVSIPGC
jgi:hypothetical protein